MKRIAKNGKNPIPTVERDISWMYFNHRILQEAQRENVPLLERLSFLGIYSNNLDEFFRVRVAALSRIAEAKSSVPKDECLKSKQTIKYITKLNELYSQEYEQCIKQVTDELKQQNICIIEERDLDRDQQMFITNFFKEKLNGNTNPIWLTAIDQLSEEPDDSIYLAVNLTTWSDGSKKTTNKHAIIKVPVNKLGRFLRLPDKDGKCYIMYMDDVIRFCLPQIFVGQKFSHIEAFSFKFTKDAEMDLDDNINTSPIQKVQKGVKSRKSGEPMRIVYDGSMPKDLLRKVMLKLHITKSDTTLSGGRYHNHKDLMSFPDCGRKDLKFPKWKPVIYPQLNTNGSLIELIKNEDRLIHVPYHTFDTYIQLLREAAISPEVRSIKTTLYRLAKDSKVIEALICAAKNKKRVTVVIELLARFDEASNISWSKQMIDAGIKVVFGVEGLKVHSKITHIETRNGDIACVGTGNFHEGNAKVYTDCLLFTASKSIVREVSRVFDFINTPFIPVQFKELLVSPNHMKQELISLINNEISNKRKGKPAYILMKLNHIVDLDVIKRLYAASAEGVKIDIVLRGNCSLVTGIPNLSDNINIHGIIDRYLEHSRILIFANGGEEKYYMGSADWMTRNLENRIEVMVPIYNIAIQSELKRIVEYGMADTMQGRVVDGSGTNNLYVNPDNDQPFRSQEELYKYYEQKAHIEQ